MIRSSLKTGGVWYKAQGGTIEEAITSLNPKVARGVSILVLEKGDVRREKIISAGTAMRLFGPASRVSKEIAWKQVLTLFDKSIFEGNDA